MSFFQPRKILRVIAAMFFSLISLQFAPVAMAEEATAKPRVLEFYASWAAPCQKLQPAMDRAKSEYGKDVEFDSYDVDDPAARALVNEYEVCPIPTLIFIDSNNKICGYSIGCTSDRPVRDGIAKILPATKTAQQKSENAIPVL